MEFEGEVVLLLFIAKEDEGEDKFLVNPLLS